MQRSFTSRIETAICYDILDLETIRDGIGMSLRQIIMELRTLDGSDQSIFLSVDYDEYNSKYQHTFPKALKSQAWDYIAQLPSYLDWAYKDPIFKLLTSSAVERALAAPWSEEDMCAISKEEMELDAYATDVNDMSWMKDFLDNNPSEVVEIDDTEKSSGK